MNLKEQAYIQILGINARFAWLIDNKNGLGVSELFTEDGEYHLGPHFVQGREQIALHYQTHNAPRKHITRHCISNISIHLFDSDVIHGTCLLTLFESSSEAVHERDISLIAGFKDTYQFSSERTWLFKSREMRPIFGETPYAVSIEPTP